MLASWLNNKNKGSCNCVKHIFIFFRSVWKLADSPILQAGQLRSPTARRDMAAVAASSSMAQAMLAPRSSMAPFSLRSSLPHLHLLPRSASSPLTHSSKLQTSGTIQQRIFFPLLLPTKIQLIWSDPRGVFMCFNLSKLLWLDVLVP